MSGRLFSRRGNLGVFQWHLYSLLKSLCVHVTYLTFSGICRRSVIDPEDSHALESQLESNFKFAKHFNAFLLLDEPDIFMVS